MRRFALAGLVLTMFLAVHPAEAVTSGSPGDITCNGVVDAADSLRFLQLAAGIGLQPVCSVANADASGDAVPGLADAIIVRRWVAGLPVQPILRSLSPVNLSAGLPATEVVITGGFMRSNTVLRWHGTDIPLQLADDGSAAVAIVPPTSLINQGLNNIELVSPGAPPSGTLLYEILTPSGCVPASGIVGSLTVDKRSEVASITLNEPRHIGGWKLISVAGNQQFTFPAGFLYNPANGPVSIWSGTEEFFPTATHLWWRPSHVWNNDTKDDGRLEDCLGNLVATWNDPSPPP